MCPEKFRAHVKLVGTDKLPTYEAIRAEIADWLAEELRKAPRPRVAAIGQANEPEQPATDADWEKDIQEYLELPLEETRVLISSLSETLDQGQLMALVKNIKLKGKKGAGKGTGPQKCYECDAEGHIASECPIRLERIKNGA